MKTLEETLNDGTRCLAQACLEEAKVDAWFLFQDFFQMSRADYYLHCKDSILEEKYCNYMDLIQKRASHIPLQYIVGSTEFMGLTFKVNENVLIPRQDTEILVEEVLKVADNKSVLDVCTGSGCIIISLAKLCNLSKAVGSDISSKALKVASDNVFSQKVGVQLLESDLFENVKGSFDIIVSNPPYISTSVIEGLMPEVRLHEPMLALDGSEDGLYFYRKMIDLAGNYLNRGGLIYFEIGHDQGEDVKNLLEIAGFSSVKVIRDLNGLDRVVCGKYTDNERK